MYRSFLYPRDFSPRVSTGTTRQSWRNWIVIPLIFATPLFAKAPLDLNIEDGNGLDRFIEKCCRSVRTIREFFSAPANWRRSSRMRIIKTGGIPIRRRA